MFVRKDLAGRITRGVLVFIIFGGFLFASAAFCVVTSNVAAPVPGVLKGAAIATVMTGILLIVAAYEIRKPVVHAAASVAIAGSVLVTGAVEIWLGSRFAPAEVAALYAGDDPSDPAVMSGNPPAHLLMTLPQEERSRKFVMYWLDDPTPATDLAGAPVHLLCDEGSVGSFYRKDRYGYVHVAGADSVPGLCSAAGQSKGDRHD